MKPLLLFVLALVLFFSCSSEDELGSCSISCGGFRTSQPFSFTNHAFVSESRCVELAEEREGSACKASYCPPTGNDEDCYEVFP